MSLLGHIFFRVLIKFCFTAWGTEVVSLAFVLGSPFSGFFIHCHFTNRINRHKAHLRFFC
jgi:hypothetical protein